MANEQDKLNIDGIIQRLLECNAEIFEYHTFISVVFLYFQFEVLNRIRTFIWAKMKCEVYVWNHVKYFLVNQFYSNLKHHWRFVVS